MDWVPGRTWGWLGPSGSLCNELFIFIIILCCLACGPFVVAHPAGPGLPVLASARGQAGSSLCASIIAWRLSALHACRYTSGSLITACQAYVGG
jgi:hypothetical protein